MANVFDGLKLRNCSFSKRRASISSLRLQIRYSLSKGTEKYNFKRLPDLKRDVARLGLPSKGRMAEDTLKLLEVNSNNKVFCFDCCWTRSVNCPSTDPILANTSPASRKSLDWFCFGVYFGPGSRSGSVVSTSDRCGTQTQVTRVHLTVLRADLRYGDMDLGIVGYDMFCEIAEEDSDLVMIHDSLDFGRCHLGLGVPNTGIYSDVNTLEELREMKLWNERRPLRVATGYSNIARKFFKEKDFEHVVLLGGDGALEAAPAMGSADIILDLVSTGVTLRENNLKELDGGTILDSQGVLVGNRQSLLKRPGLLPIVKELIERFDAHLKASKYFSVISNMRGESAQAVAEKLIKNKELAGLQGPTISPVFSARGEENNIFATVICVKKKNLYKAVQQLRQLGGSGVLVQPMTYIFDEEPIRWSNLLKALGVSESDCV